MFTEQIRTYGKYGRGIHTAVTRVSLYKARAATERLHDLVHDRVAREDDVRGGGRVEQPASHEALISRLHLI